MNKLKTKILMVSVLCFLLLPLFFSGNNATADTTLVAGDPLITGINAVIKGYDGVDQSSPLSMNQVYNATIPIIGLHADSFTAESQAPDNFQTDGITRTYSDALWSTITTPTSASARGMYSTLRSMPESDFSQLTVERDVGVVTYTPEESFYTTVNDTLYAENPSWTAENFTVSEMYYLLSFDRVLVDAFFASAMAKDGYGLVTSTESTNTQLIENLLDDLFTEHCLDIIYSPINVSTALYYSSTWTVAEEVRSVLGGNATNLSVNATIKNVSIRNAAWGYMGEKIVGDTVIGQSVETVIPEEGPFSGFYATPTTYSIRFNVRGDYASSPLSADLAGLFTILTEAEIEELKQALLANIGEGCLIAAGIGVGLGLIAYLIRRNKPDKVLVTFVAFTSGFIVTLVIYLVMTVVVL